MEEESTEEQFFDVILSDTHKILSVVSQDLENLGYKDLPVVEDKFHLI